MPSKPLIIWEKWVDPFGQDSEDTKWTDYEDSEDTLEDILHENPEATELDNIIKSSPIRALSTPMGLIPYNEATASGKIFKFWVGHTNFNISYKVQKIIEEVEGVEILDIFTRYRFRIAIGKSFNDSTTMTDISDHIDRALQHD